MEYSRERSWVATVCLAIAGSSAGVAVATVIARAVGADTLMPGVAGAVLGIALGAALRARLAVRLPAELDGWFARRRVVAALWIAVAVLAVANTARLGLFIADPAQQWASAFPPVRALARHQCIAAYVRAGELAARGQANLWDDADYSAHDHGPVPSTGVRGLDRYLSDPYEYPPVLVIAPRAALAVTDDYQVIRAAWFGLSAVGFWLAFVAFAAWLGGRAGATSLLFAPVIALSTPVMFGLQFGQVHLLVVAAAVAAMMQFARGRRVGGGMLLGFATATKIFPGLLLVFLAVRRQWRDVAVTLVALAALIALAAIVLGPATLAAFVSHHLPRMSSGEAFAFTEDNPDNYSLYGLAFKLGSLGLDAGRPLASRLAWGWTAVAVALTVIAARRAGPRDAVAWLAVLCVATLRSPFAPTYAMIATLWLLSVWAGELAPRRWRSALIAVCWILLQGAPPLGSEAIQAAATLPAQTAAIAIAVLAARRRASVPR